LKQVKEEPEGRSTNLVSLEKQSLKWSRVGRLSAKAIATFVVLLQPLHLDFIVAAANLRAAIYGIAQTRDHRAIAAMALEVEVPVFVPKAGVRIEVTESEVQSRNNGGTYGSFSLTVPSTPVTN